MILRPQTSTLFPYTTLFRSVLVHVQRSEAHVHAIEKAHDVQRERSEEHTSELQSHLNLVCRLLLEKKKHVLQSLGDLSLSQHCGAHAALLCDLCGRRGIAYA